MIEYSEYLELLSSPSKGRYLVASVDIPCHTVIIRNPPYASVSCSPFFCDTCFGKLLQAAEQRPFSCEDCANNTAPFEIQDKSLVILCYNVVKRLLTEKDFDYEDFVKIDDQKSSTATKEYANDFISIAKMISKDLLVSDSDVEKVADNLSRDVSCDLERSQLTDLIRRVFSKFPCNVQGLRCVSEDDSGKLSEARIGSAIYPTLALMNHSCSPNTRLYFEKSDAVVVTTADVSRGEELFHNYGPDVLAGDTLQRRRILKRQYGFLCGCNACLTKELQYSHKCESCGAPVWFDGDDVECGECGKQIHHSCFRSRIHEVMELLYELEEGITRNGDLVDDLVFKAMELYPPESIQLGSIMDSCAEFYREVENWASALQCRNVSCKVVEIAVGRESHTHLLELMKMCCLGIDALKAGYKDIDISKLRKDSALCVELLGKCKIYKMKSLEVLKEWNKSS